MRLGKHCPDFKRYRPCPVESGAGLRQHGSLKAGFDSYIIYNGASESNIAVVQGPGTYNTTAIANGPFINATTTYQPGPPMVIGHHGQSFAIKMFHQGEPGSENALSAKAALGPDWQKQLKNPVLTCVG